MNPPTTTLHPFECLGSARVRLAPALLALAFAFAFAAGGAAQTAPPTTDRDPATHSLTVALEITPSDTSRPPQNPASFNAKATVVSTTGVPTRLELVAGSVVLGELHPEIPIELALIPPGTPVAYHGAWTALAPATYAVTARTAPEWRPAAASSVVPVTVAPAPSSSPGATLVFDSPTPGSRFESAAGVPILVSATDPNGSIRHLEIHAGDQLIAVSRILTRDADVPGRPRAHRLLWSNPPPGTHRLTAWAADANGRPVASDAVSIDVVATSPTPTIRLVTPRPGQVLRSGDSVAVEVVTSGRFGGITHVEAWLDGRKAAESALFFIRPPEAHELVQHTMEIANVPPGPHRIEVRDVADPSLTSGTVEFAVGRGATLRIVSPAAGTVHRPGASIEIAAEGTGVEGGMTRVEFLVNGQKAGESSIQFILPPAASDVVRHTFTLPALPAGRHELAARSIEPDGVASLPIPIQVAEVSVGPVDPDPALGLRTLQDGTLCLVIKDSPNASGRIEIEASHDLSTWETIAVLDDPGTAIAQPASPPTSPERRFFRAVRRP